MDIYKGDAFNHLQSYILSIFKLNVSLENYKIRLGTPYKIFTPTVSLVLVVTITRNIEKMIINNKEPLGVHLSFLWFRSLGGLPILEDKYRT